MTTSPSEIVRAFMAAMELKDYDSGLKLLSADCEYTNIPMSTVRGPEAVRAVLEPFFAPVIENEFLILREASAGPIVFIERLDRHRLAKGWVELPVTGVLEVHGGKITVWREYFDLATIMKEMPAA
ncbi:MAG TPA: limonene-1,2-epoxide hydrolase family protein [Rhizomicrobium sp.]|nr:limonene-1,2-epoxide hydrolase family protein [Rhizomicrobium sp.]